MFIVLTPEEELASRREKFEGLVPGKLFALSMERYFLTVEKSGDLLEVIELNDENIKCILNEQSCVHSTLNFDEMICLNVIEHRSVFTYKPQA